MEKICKNQNSLRNHERLCKKNPNRDSFAKSPESEQKRLQNLKIANRNKDFSRRLCTCQFCKKEWSTTKTGWHLHEFYCHSNPNRKPGTFKGRKRSEEEKRKISEGQKIAHKEGRNCSWIGRRKRSFAEQFWYDIFAKDLGENSFENNYKVPNSKSAYFLDFAWPDRKLYFEVDGETHYSEEGKKHDEERAKFLQDKGWLLICRCRWSDFQKLSGDEKYSYIQDIEMQIKQQL